MARGQETIQLATRSSALALRQAASVKEALTTRRLAVELVEVETKGDAIRDELIHRLGTTGAFVRSLDERVLAGEVDGAIHSMKDMPTDLPPELVVAAVPNRATARDVLVTPDGTAFTELPPGATIGTSSLRRQAQVRSQREDLELVKLRGNVDTRIEKLLAPRLQREHQRRLDATAAASSGSDDDTAVGDAVDNDKAAAETGDGESDTSTESGMEQSPETDQSESTTAVDEWFEQRSEIERRALERRVETEYDAIVLAAAGLERSELIEQVPTESLSTDAFVPSAGQGALAITMRDEDRAEQVHERLDHPPSRIATTTERSVLATLGAGCVAPIGVHAIIQGEYVTTRAQVCSRDGQTVVEGVRDIPIERHAADARAFATELADDGAAELVEAARREQPDEPKRGG